MPVRLTIDALGRQGDGIARSDNGPVYIPFTLADEVVLAHVEKDRGELVEIIEPSPARQFPVCAHFGQCGGCALQHLQNSQYLKFKHKQLCDALITSGVDASVDAVHSFHDKRRRATFAARRTKKRVILGFLSRRTHEIVNIDNCPVIMPEITALLPGFREWLGRGLTRKGQAQISVLWTHSGADVAITGAREPDAALLSHLAAMAEALDLARLNWNGETIAARRKPVLLFGGISITPPPGGFVQALKAAERLMADKLCEWLDEGPLVDLFAGSGAFSLPLAGAMPVHAVDSDKASLAALGKAVSQAQGLKPVTVEQRDLFKDPLSVEELNRFASALFDPPRAGAKAQSVELAASNIRRIAAISCNPSSFARDARILIDGGYRIEKLILIDQFQYSPHIELAALFTANDG